MSQYETEVTEGVFLLGGMNDALAQYFSGTSYMNTLVNDPDVPVTVANVSFEPGFVITGISIMAGSRSSWRRRGRVGTRKKDSHPSSSMLGMWRSPKTA